MEKPAIATPLSADAVAAAIVPGYVRHFGAAPDRETAELLTALVWIENTRGAAIMNHNWGNVSCSASAAVDYWRPPWFDLDAINARPDTDKNKARYLSLHQQMLDHKEPSAFRAFDSDDAGIANWLVNVKPSMYAAASTGDPMAFAAAYFGSGYCPDQACKNSGPTFAKLQTEIRGKGYFAALEPAKKKAQPSPLPTASPLPPVELIQSSPPPPLPSSLGSSGAPFTSERAVDMKRELVVFAASVQLESFQLLTKNADAAGIRALIESFWRDVLPPPYAAGVSFPPQWCGAFALWCLHQAGIGLDLRWMFGPPHYGFLWSLTQTDTPEPGDIAYLDKPFQHHAIVVSVEGDTIHTIDGNQGPHAPVMTHEAPRGHWSAFYSIASLLGDEVAA